MWSLSALEDVERIFNQLGVETRVAFMAGDAQEVYWQRLAKAEELAMAARSLTRHGSYIFIHRSLVWGACKELS